MDYNIHKICRVCLEEGALTSIYSTEFAMMPCTMLMMCAKIRVHTKSQDSVFMSKKLLKTKYYLLRFIKVMVYLQSYAIIAFIVWVWRTISNKSARTLIWDCDNTWVCRTEDMGKLQLYRVCVCKQFIIFFKFLWCRNEHRLASWIVEP